VRQIDVESPEHEAGLVRAPTKVMVVKVESEQFIKANVARLPEIHGKE
jgi:hypothetical protein